MKQKKKIFHCPIVFSFLLGIILFPAIYPTVLSLAGELPIPKTQPSSSTKTELLSAKKKHKSAQPLSPTLLQSIQTTWDGIQSYQANFTQSVITKGVPTPEITEGILYVQKPNRLRWEAKGEETVQIMNQDKDGKRQLINITKSKRRKNRIVEQYSDLTKVIESSSLDFLSGKVKIAEIYSAFQIKESKDLVTIEFIAKSNPEDSLLAEIDKKSYLLHALITENANSTVKTEFSNVTTNRKLEESLFTYQPNPTDVVHQNN